MTFPPSGQAYQILSSDQQTTTVGTCSPRGIDGHLLFVENPIARTWASAHGVPGRQLFISKTGQALGSSFGYGDPPLGPFERLKRYTLATAQARFKNTVQEKALLAMEYIHERKRLASRLEEIGWELYRIVKQLMQRKFKTVYRRLAHSGKKVASRKEMTFHEKWLEYHFVVAPMMADFERNVYAIEPAHTLVVRRRSRESDVTADNGVNWVNFYTSERFASVRTTLRGEIVIDDPIEAVKSKLGFEVGDLWDIIPFSFVLDWFVNMGQIVKAITVPGFTYSNTSITVLEKDIIDHNGWVVPNFSTSGYYSQVGGVYSRQWIAYNRTPGDITRIPFVWTGGINSLWRALTAISLARTITKR